MTGIPPVDLLVPKEKKYTKGKRRKTLESVLSKNGKGSRAPSKNRWIYWFIRNLKAWCWMEHSETNYYLTQILTVHGCFKICIHRISKKGKAKCQRCKRAVDDTYHIVLRCSAWTHERSILKDKEVLPPEKYCPIHVKE